MIELKEGMRVRLKPNEKYGWLEEFGILNGVDEKSQTAVVTLDPEFRGPHKKDPDGLREVGLDQIEPAE